MSASSSILNSIRQTPTADTLKSEHQIFLVDQERGQQQQEEGEDREEEGSETQDTERNDSEAPALPEPTPLTHRLTRNSSQLPESLKRQWTKRKYAKYDRDRYDLSSSPLPPDEDPANHPQAGEAASATQISYLERSRAKAKTLLLRRKRTLGTGKDAQDSVIDILYENQRGFFWFGIPRYSSSSLFPHDPAPWQNAQFRSSPVDIRNAQVPDPSWTWAWKSWYVDMSRDVDEEGWEYSLKFHGGSPWHGNHPWFHSFVRRRRWLRMRKRRDLHHRTKEKAHEFTAEYFTIHPSTLRAAGEQFGGQREDEESSEAERLREKWEEEQESKDAEKMEILDIASLIHLLRRAPVDREKLSAVRKFVTAATEELYYLSDRMEEIMNLFIYQSSRRQLLSYLLQRFDQAQTRRESLTDHTHHDQDAQREHDKAAQQAENLMNAVKAADQQVKRLEFWSDIKGMAYRGETLLETNEGKGWNLERWQGLSPTATEKGGQMEEAFASLQTAGEGAPALHRHPEHSSSSALKGKGKKTEEHDDEDEESAVTAPSKKSSGGGSSRILAVKHPAAGGKESSTSETEGYVTAAESASELPGVSTQKGKGKPKTRLSNLDGVQEIGEESESEGNIIPPAPEPEPSTPLTSPQPQPQPPLRRSSTHPASTKHSVQIVEPVPEPLDDRSAGGRGGGGDGS